MRLDKGIIGQMSADLKLMCAVNLFWEISSEIHLLSSHQRVGALSLVPPHPYPPRSIAFLTSSEPQKTLDLDLSSSSRFILIHENLPSYSFGSLWTFASWNNGSILLDQSSLILKDLLVLHGVDADSIGKIKVMIQSIQHTV